MEFIKGMDISGLPEMWKLGAKFLDKNGVERNIFELLKENGVNSIRLRIWNEPENIPESGGYCNLEQTIAMAKTVKQFGMSFFLDFHYSDWWADPGKQVKPKAWSDLGFEELKQAVYDYTCAVLQRMQQEDVFPDMVQIGNEIRSGMLFPEGEVPYFGRLVPLVNAGIRAVRDIAQEQDTKVVIHLDQGGRYFYLRDWFDAALKEGLEDFDIIGVSYYPFWHGTFGELKETLVQMVKRYGKPIVIAETAHPWRSSIDGFVGEQQERIASFPATKEAQKEVIDLVMNITASLEEEMGIGIYYWEPAVIPLEGTSGWCSNMGIFDEEGRTLPTLTSFNFERSMFLSKVAKIYEPEKTVVLVGSEAKLPRYLRVLFYDGNCPELAVVWEEFAIEKPGKILIQGNIPEIDRSVKAEVLIVEKLEEDYNFIPNAGFERGMEGWKIDCADERVKTELHPEFINPFPAPPVYYMNVESPVNFIWKLEREVDGLAPGQYRLQVEYRGTNTTGVDVRLFRQSEENNRKETIIYPTDEDWITYELSSIPVSNGKIRFGLIMVSPPVYGKIRKFTLTKQ